MTSDVELAGVRSLALADGRAYLSRSTFQIVADPDPSFCIALIGMVSENVPMAVAFGPMGGQPEIVTRWHPLGRDSGDLEPFARAITAYVDDALSKGVLPRFYLLNESSLELIKLLGYRYRGNDNASPVLQRLGTLCQAIAEEATFPGQQIVVLIGPLLAEHVVTGQSAVKDQHARSLLAWMFPPAGRDPWSAADEAALVPAASRLTRQHDDEVEALRKKAKGHTNAARAARRRLERILASGAQEEWQLIQRLHHVFWNLGLDHLPAGGKLADLSRRRFEFAVLNDPSRPVWPPALARRLADMELCLELTEGADIAADVHARERARLDGRVVQATVERLDISRQGHKRLVVLTLSTAQTVLRIRPDSWLKHMDSIAAGRVLAPIRFDPVTRRTTFRVRLFAGHVKYVPSIGAELDWTDSKSSANSFFKRKSRTSIPTDRRALVAVGNLGLPVPRPVPPIDLAVLAESLRAGSDV